MLFGWLGMNDSKIGELAIDALREQENLPVVKKVITFELQEKPLPDNCKKFTEVTEAIALSLKKQYLEELPKKEPKVVQTDLENLIKEIKDGQSKN